MKEPIVLGLGAEVPDEVLETRGAQIRARAEAFIEELTALSRKHDIWVEDTEMTPLLIDGVTQLYVAEADWRSNDHDYELRLFGDIRAPASYRRRIIAHEEERRLEREKWERERAEMLQKQAEEEQRMRAAGYERMEYRHTPGMGMQYTEGGTIYAVGTAGAWYNPQTGHVYTGGTPDPKEYRP